MNSFKTIAEQHPESVALVFQKHFINAQPTERNLTNAIKIKGEVFCLDLVDAIESKREESNFLGLFESKEKRAEKKAARIAKREAAAKAAAANPEAAKKGFTLEKALNIFSTVAGAAGSLLNKGSNTATNNDAADNDPNQTDRILGIDRNMFYVLAVLALIILVMMIRKAKK